MHHAIKENITKEHNTKKRTAIFCCTIEYFGENNKICYENTTHSNRKLKIKKAKLYGK